MADKDPKEAPAAIPSPETKADVTEKQAPAKAEPKPKANLGPEAELSEDNIPVAALIAQSSDFLGHPSFVTAGALYDLAPEDQLTIDDAKTRVANWLKQPVEEA